MRLVVLGLRAAWWAVTLVVVLMIGCAAVRCCMVMLAALLLLSFIVNGDASSESGETAKEGPEGDDVRERWRAGVDLEAKLERAAARSFW